MTPRSLPLPQKLRNWTSLFTPGRTAEHIRTTTAIEGAIVFVAFVAALAIVQYATPALVGTDGYYHAKMGYLIRNEGLKPLFDYLPFTILNQNAYYDHHLLYHLWLALFAGVDPLTDGGVSLARGAKLASVILPAITFTALWGVLKNQRLPFAWLWSLSLLALSEPFLMRMSMPRAQSLSLLFLLLAIHLLLTRRYSWLLPLGFLFVWAYNAFPLLLVVAGTYVIATWMTERRFAWAALAWPAAGIMLGMVVNPYFPENIPFIIDHLLPKLGESTTLVGNEWSPYLTLTLLENSGPTFLLLLGAVLALVWREQRIDKRTLFMLGLTIVFGAMLFRSRRFIEYFPPFVLLLTAFAAAPLLNAWLARWQRGRRWAAPLLRAGMLLMLILPIRSTLTGAAELTAASKPADLYADAALWLGAQADPGAQIFQTDWDDFTRLFFYNSTATYTAGLDPTFMELHDPAFFDRWVAITQGDVDQPGRLIRDQFKADYVFSDLNHGDFARRAADDPLLREVYRDQYAVIYEVLDEKRGNP